MVMFKPPGEKIYDVLNYDKSIESYSVFSLSKQKFYISALVFILLVCESNCPHSTNKKQKPQWRSSGPPRWACACSYKKSKGVISGSVRSFQIGLWILKITMCQMYRWGSGSLTPIEHMWKRIIIEKLQAGVLDQKRVDNTCVNINIVLVLLVNNSVSITG